jgi:hypothetical protein
MATSDYDAALAGSANQGRVPMGNEGVKFTSPSSNPASGTAMPKGNVQAGDPTAAGTKVNRVNAPYVERNGAAYSVGTKYMKTTDPAAGMTQANGRVINPTIIRQSDSFGEGVGTSY